MVWNCVDDVSVHREDTQYYGVREVKISGGGTYATAHEAIISSRRGYLMNPEVNSLYQMNLKL